MIAIRVNRIRVDPRADLFCVFQRSYVFNWSRYSRCYIGESSCSLLFTKNSKNSKADFFELAI